MRKIFYEYDESGNVLYDVSSNNTIIAYEYDSHNRVIKAHYQTYTGVFYGFDVDTKEPVVSEDITEKYYKVYEYNTYGLPTKVWTYDSANPSKYIYTTQTYLTDDNSHIFGALLTEKSSYQNETRYFYDETNGRLLAITYPDGNGVSYEYDLMGNLTQVLPATLITSGTSYSYEEVASSASVEYVYHSVNKRLTSIETATTTYHFLYDVFGNTTEISIDDQVLADYSYNENNGKLDMFTYGNGLKVKYLNDQLDRISEIQYNIGEDESFETVYRYAYNSAGSLYSVTDCVNQEVTVYQYDSTGRLLKTYLCDTETYLSRFNVSLTYDGHSRVDERVYYLDYEYTGDSIVENYLSYSYVYNDITGNLSIIFIDGVDDCRVIPIYDAFGRTKQKSIDFYGDFGRFYNEINYTYATVSGSESMLVSQVESIVRERANSIENWSHQIWKYTYDDNGNITKITDGNNVIQFQYEYDDLGQLIREDNRAKNRSYTYAYDHGGNLTAKKEYNFTTGTLGTELHTYSYSYGNSTWGDLLTSWDGKPIVYDDIGNPEQIGTDSDGAQLTWQGRQLMSYQTYSEMGPNMAYGQLVSFDYNADGIRTSKTIGGVEHKYYLDGSQIIAEMWTVNNVEYLLYYLYDETGTPIGIEYRTSNYGKTAFDRYYFEKNLQGDIIAVYRAVDGAKICSYTYNAWGECSVNIYTVSNLSDADTYIRNNNPFRYRGYYYDTETGLYYLQSRYYNPKWGRFLNADGYVSTGTGLLGYNMFAYCNNNPVMFIDPSGNLLFALIGAGLLLFGTTVLLTSSEKQEPTQAQIEQAITAASNADYYVTIDKNGSTTVDISISLSDEDTQFDSIASEYFYQALYDEAHQKLIEAGFDIEDSNLMTVDHIRWEFAIHKIGYDSKIPFLQGPCNPVDLNVDETFWTILDRFWGYLLG